MKGKGASPRQPRARASGSRVRALTVLAAACLAGAPLACSSSEPGASPEAAVAQLISAARSGDRAAVYHRLGPSTRGHIDDIEGQGARRLDEDQPRAVTGQVDHRVRRQRRIEVAGLHAKAAQVGVAEAPAGPDAPPQSHDLLAAFGTKIWTVICEERQSSCIIVNSWKKQPIRVQMRPKSARLKNS